MITKRIQLRRLREIEPSLRVVLASGFPGAEATRRFAGRGLAGFLQKPYTLEALATMVGRCLGASDEPRAGGSEG
jgi:FixJ family two-component response regulator